ncbi:MAG: hypothetical protein ABIQ09_15980 [Jatrophihabitantaceae bacterium]
MFEELSALRAAFTQAGVLRTLSGKSLAVLFWTNDPIGAVALPLVSPA